MALSPSHNDPNRKKELERKRAEPDSFNERRDPTRGSAASKPKGRQ